MSQNGALLLTWKQCHLILFSLALGRTRTLQSAEHYNVGISFLCTPASSPSQDV